MMLTLTLVPLLFVREVFEIIDPKAGYWTLERWASRIMIAGLVVVTLTGMFPARYDKDPLSATSIASTWRYTVYGQIHTYGVMIGAVVPTFFMYGAFLYKYFTTGHYTPGGVACRSIYVFCILAAFATMMP